MLLLLLFVGMESSSRRREELAAVLERLELIGEGRSAKVYKAKRKDTGEIVAVKVVPLVLESGADHILDQLETLHGSEHEGIVDFKGAFYSDGNLSIVMEFMDLLSLKDILLTKKVLPEPAIACISNKVLSALDFLHRSRHLIHRDVKPSNILVSSSGEVKLSDFGVCGKLKDSLSKARTFLGTTAYMSPERITGHPYTYVSDIWSLGLVLLECACGRFPYENANESVFKLMDEVVRSASPIEKIDTSGFSELFVLFLKECLDKSQDSRANAEELMDHPFLEEARETPCDLASLLS